MKKGFTLIELLVVVSIIGTLATVLVVNLSSSQVKARNARIQNDVEQLSQAAEIILLGSGAFPSVGGLVTDTIRTGDAYLKLTGTSNVANVSIGVNAFREDNSTVNLISTSPTNPASSDTANKYSYYWMRTNLAGTQYIIYTMAADTFKSGDPTLAIGDKFYYCKTGKNCGIKPLVAGDLTVPTY